MKKLTIIKVGMLCILLCTVFFGCGTDSKTKYYSADDEAMNASGTMTEPGEENLDGEPEGDLGDEVDSLKQTEDENSEICVHVCGQVVRPGVYTLPSGSRVCDAIDLAGGFTEAASVEYWNQADYLEDAMQLYVPTEDEVDLLMDEGIYGGLPISRNSSVESNSGIDSDGRVNLNTATIEELTTITGIGETRAKAIIDYRTEAGGFSSTEEITNVSGIGEATYEKIKDSIRVN